MESDFFCYGAMCFPHIGLFSFSHSEWINLQKESLENKMYVNFIFKGCFFVLKDVDSNKSCKL